MKKSRAYSTIEILKAIRMRELEGRTWKEAARELGRSVGGLKNGVRRFLNGGKCKDKDTTLARLNEARLALATGGRVVDLATKWGVSSARVCRLLNDHGITTQERAAMRRRWRERRHLILSRGDWHGPERSERSL